VSIRPGYALSVYSGKFSSVNMLDAPLSDRTQRDRLAMTHHAAKDVGTTGLAGSGIYGAFFFVFPCRNFTEVRLTASLDVLCVREIWIFSPSTCFGRVTLLFSRAIGLFFRPFQMLSPKSRCGLSDKDLRGARDVSSDPRKGPDMIAAVPTKARQR
jgi:hypothetical protein